MYRLRLATLPLLLLIVAGSALTGKDNPEPTSKAYWPQWRGPNRDAICTEKGLLTEWPADGPKMLWRAKNIGVAYSGVSIVGDRIYTMGDRAGKQLVLCLDATQQGKEIWATPVGSPHGGGTPGARCTPVVDGKFIYAETTDGAVICLEAATGKEKWKKDLVKDFGGRMMSGWRWSESPLIDGDKLICTPGADKAAMVALKKDTGEEIWRSEVKSAGGAGYSSPAVAEVKGTRMYINWLRSGLIAVSAKDGKFLWKYSRNANGTANIPTPVVKGDLVFCSTGYGAGSALLKLEATDTGVDAKEQYFLRGDELQNHHGGMVLLGDYVYLGHAHNNGHPRCVDLKTGTVKWQDKGPGSGSAAVMYADGHLYFRYQNHVVALIEAKPDGYKLKSKFNLPKDTGGQGWQHPAIANGKLYIRGADSLMCFDIKAK